MSLGLVCELSLSKKLRAILKNGGAITLAASNIQDGRAQALLTLSSVSKDDLEGVIGSETSIILRPTGVSTQPIHDQEETPREFSQPVSSIFSVKDQKSNKYDRTPVDRLAATSVPETKQARAEAIKTKTEVGIPPAFKELREQSCKDYIDNLTSLLEAAAAAEGKDSGIDPSKISDPRRRAVAIEEKERAEAISIPSYIVNTSCASLSVNDLGLSLLLNVPFNLANISAKRLIASSDLKSMLKAKLIKFITPSEIGKYMREATREEPGSLETFSHHREAESSFERNAPSANEVEVSVDELDRPTEQEQILHLSGHGTARTTSTSLSGGVRTSSHSLNSPHFRKTISDEATENAKGIKTIRRA